MKNVYVTPKAHKQISKLNRQDMASIYAALEGLQEWPNVGGVKKLIDTPGYRLRIGQYRALFDVVGNIVTVTEVKIRNEHTY